jgi:hypothetical protein
MKHTNDIIRMAREAGFNLEHGFLLRVTGIDEDLERFAALVAAAERNKVAQWMIDHSYATGHGDTTEDLLDELDWQITESWSKVVVASVEAEREAIIQMMPGGSCVDPQWVCDAIRARGQDAA